MFQRVMVAVVCVPLIFVVFFLLPPICLPIAIAALAMVAVHEVLWSTGFVKNPRISGYSIALAGVMPFWVYFGEPQAAGLCGLLLYLLLVVIEAISSHYTVTMEKMGGAFFFAILIPYFMSSFVRLDAMRLGDYLILLPLVAAFGSDAFALFGGLLFGRHKLAPDLSPKKTVEGAVTGFVAAIVWALVYGLVMELAFQLRVDYLLLGVYGALGSLAAQLGDLFFSYVKRQYKIKDFGNIFPGHGGVLDRFDSILFCAPLMELLILFLPALTR